MESMRSTWTDTRLEEFAAGVNDRFDRVDGQLHKVEGRLGAVEGRLGAVETRFDEVDRRLDKLDVDMRDIRTELAANSRSMLQFCGAIIAAQMATVATLIAIHG